jgi:hypothetical protein
MLAERYDVRVPYPRVEVGLVHMAVEAKPLLLILAVVIFPITFIMTSIRWHQLLRAVSIMMPLSRRS